MPSLHKTYVIYSANYLPNVGGVERYTQNLGRELVLRGHRVIVVTNNVFNLADQETEDTGIELVRLPCRNILDGRFPLARRNSTFTRLQQWLREQTVDYVIVNTRFYPHSLLGIKLAEEKGVVPLIIEHGSAHLTMGSAAVDLFVSAYEHAFTALVKQHRAHYYAVSQAGVEWITHFDIKAKGALCNSIDADRFTSQASGRNFRSELGLPDQAFVVAFTGRFIPEKGIEALVEAARALQDNPHMVFLLAGDGPLKEVIEKSGLTNMKILGVLSGPDVASLLLDAQVFCLPTRSEGFSTSLLEAAACATTPVITHVGGVDELIPSAEYGILLNEATSTEIVEKIRLLYADQNLNRAIGENIARRVRSEFSWAATATRTQAACELANPVSPEIAYD